MPELEFYGGPCGGETRTLATAPAYGERLECKGTAYYVYPFTSGKFAAILVQITDSKVAPKPANVLRGYADFRNTVQAHIPTGSKRAGLLAAATLRNLRRVARFHG